VGTFVNSNRKKRYFIVFSISILIKWAHNRWDTSQILEKVHFDENLRGKKEKNVLKGGPGRI